MSPLMADLINHLNWSHSRGQSLQNCKRLYYYQYYLSWNGWKPEEAQVRRHAYRLKQMRSFATFAGELVHEQIKRILLEWMQTGTVMTVQESIELCWFAWNKALDESQSLQWLHRPKQFRCFLEDYYVSKDRQRRMEVAWNSVRICLGNFYKSKTWRQIRSSSCDCWLALDSDPFTPTTVNDIPMFGRPDFAYGRMDGGRGKGVCRVFDWKTGKPRESDARQLRFYALYAESLWGFPSEDIKARLVYLNPTIIEEEVVFTHKQLQNAKIEMEESFAEMAALLTDRMNNVPLEIADFPTIKRPDLCPYCSFQEVCPERSALVQTLKREAI